MNTATSPEVAALSEEAPRRWRREYAQQIGSDREIVNRSGIPIQPLYTPEDTHPGRYQSDLGYPGQPPFTRGIYPTMHRGRTWTQRQLIGLGTPANYNQRLRDILGQGATAVSLIPCNSIFRGYDMDEVDAELLGTCGVVVNCADHMDTCLEGVDLARTSCAMNDPSPFTLLAFMLCTAKRRGVDWRSITGTSNQSDFLSHYVANHMFFRIALPGARKILTDHIAWCQQHVPRWNPLSVVGQHMQQAGATPAEAMAFTLCSAVQYAEDCIAAGLDVDDLLPRFTFFFDISVSLFEEVAKFRAGRRIWSRLTQERLGAKDPRSWRFKFHGQTSGVDLTRQQPLNNVARVTVQAMAGIFGGLQSLHTDAYDEALSCPSQFGARIAVATQNILREEAHLTDVIDPLGGSYYVEKLTDDMEEKILSIMAEVDARGGMYKAVETGFVQQRIGESARRFQQQIDSGEQVVVGVNAYQVDEDASAHPTNPRPDPALMDAHRRQFERFKRDRSNDAVRASLDALARAANGDGANIFGRVVEATDVGATHGEVCGLLRRELGFGRPLPMV